MKTQTYFWILVCLMVALVSACSRQIAVAPNPNAILTRTPTRTVTLTPTQTSTRTQSATPTETDTETSTATSTSTPSMTPSRTQTSTLTSTPTLVPTSTFTSTRTDTPVPPTATETSTDTPVPTDTDTPAAPTDTDTPTTTATSTDTAMTGCPFTYNPGVIATTTPVAPTCYQEIESVGQGGATGTNDTCAAMEDLGTLNAGAELFINGSLLSAGNDGSTYLTSNDVDNYIFTTGVGGSYTFTLECFTTGADTNDLDVYLILPDCSFTGLGSGTGSPIQTFQATAPGGIQGVIQVVGWDGVGPISYKLTVTQP